MGCVGECARGEMQRFCGVCVCVCVCVCVLCEQVGRIISASVKSACAC
jgi:hypothetical protein